MSPLSATPSRAPMAAGAALGLCALSALMLLVSSWSTHGQDPIEDYSWAWWLLGLNFGLWALCLVLLAAAGVARRLARHVLVPRRTYTLLVLDVAALIGLGLSEPFWGAAIPTHLL